MSDMQLPIQDMSNSQIDLANFKLLPTGEILLYVKRNHMTTDGWQVRFDLQFLITRAYLLNHFVPNGSGGWKSPATGNHFTQDELRAFLGRLLEDKIMKDPDFIGLLQFANDEAQRSANRGDCTFPTRSWPFYGTQEVDEETLSHARSSIVAETTEKSKDPRYEGATDLFFGSADAQSSIDTKETFETSIHTS
jgi:hypothetical protein